MDFLTDWGYFGLFLSAFLAATILPLSSEVVLSALLLNGWSPIVLVSMATVGNVLGSVVNYVMGRWLGVHVIKRWLRMSDQEFDKAEQRFTKYGLWSLCLAWVPVIGDPLTVMAGILRVRFMWFLVLVTLGKLGRYVVVSYFALQI